MLLIAFTSQTVGIFNIAIAQETTVIEVVENNENFSIENNEKFEENNLNENQNVENNLDENIDNETEGLEKVENQDENPEILKNPEILENENIENIENLENIENEKLENNENLENAIITRTTTDNIETIENTDNNDLSGKIELRILTEDKNEDGSPKNEYYTGEEILTYAEFRVSGADFMIANASVRVSVAKNWVSKPVFSKSDSATSWLISEDDEKYYAIYNFDFLRWWNIVAVPVRFSHYKSNIYNWFETPVKIEILDSEKNIIKSHTQIYKIKSYDNNFCVSWFCEEDEKRFEHNIEGLLEWEDEIINENTSKIIEKHFYFRVKSPDGIYSNWANYWYNIKLIYNLPNWVRPFGNPNEDWKYCYNKDHNESCWVYDKNNNSMIFEWYYNEEDYVIRNYETVELRLSFSNLPYNEYIESNITLIEFPNTPWEKITENIKVYDKFIPEVNWNIFLRGEFDVLSQNVFLKKILTNDYVNINTILTNKNIEKTPPLGEDVLYYDYYFNASNYSRPVKITANIPDWAVMYGNPNEEWKYCYNNFCWQYDSNSRVAIYDGNIDNSKINLKLAFPDRPFDEEYVLNSQLKINPNTDKEIIKNLEHKHSFTLEKIELTENNTVISKPFDNNDCYLSSCKTINLNSDYSNVEEVKNKTHNINYYLTFGDDFGVVWYNHSIWSIIRKDDDYWYFLDVNKVKVKEFVDYDLDDRLEYTYFDLGYCDLMNQNDCDRLSKSNFNVYGVLDNWEDILLWDKNYLYKNEQININNPKIRKLKLVFDDPFDITGINIDFRLGTKVKQNIYSDFVIDRNNNSLKNIINKSKIIYIDNNIEKEKNSEEIFDINKNFRIKSRSPKKLKWDFRLNNRNSVYKTVQYWDNNNVEFNFDYQHAEINVNPDPDDYLSTDYAEVDNLYYVILLPVGIEFLKDEINNVDISDAKIIKNYKNTWKTAVFVKASSYWGDWHNYWSIDVNPTFDVKIYANEWDNLIEYFFIWDNNKETDETGVIAIGDNIYTDELDLDNDWDKTEKFLRWTSVIRFIPPREILLKKLVSTDSVSWALDTFADITDNVFYKINILNNSLRELNSLEILDVLPFVGDHNISPDDNNTYSPRGSEYNIELSDSLESIPQNTDFLDKFEVLYSTVRQWSDLSSVRDEEFVTADEIADFSTVKNIKIRLKEGQIFPVKQEASFIIKAKQIVDHTIENLKVSHNSSAFSLNEIDFSEWNKATTTIVKYQIQWKIFHDTNKNWNIDENEKSLANYSLALFNSDWTPVIDSQTNSPLITDSDNNGNYVFDVYKRWDYFVKLTKKFPEEIPTILTENNSAIIDDSDVENMTLKTNIFTLDPSNIKIQNPHSHGSSLFKLANFGLNYPSAKITINKIDEQNPEIKIANAVFEIKKDNIVLDTIVTDNNWIATTRELPIGYEYEIVEISTPATYQKSKPQNIKIETEGEIEYEILSIKTPILIPVSVLTWNTSFRSFAGGGISVPIINNFSSKENILPNFSIFWENFVENKNSTKIIFDIKNENLENSENNFTQNSQNFSWNIENTEIIDDLFSPDFAKNTEKNNFDLKEKFLQNLKNQISNFYENKSENLEKFLSENSLENIEKILEENILLEKFNFDKNFIQNNLSEIIENSENFEEKNYIKNFLEEKILNSANNSEKEIFTILDNNFDTEFSDYAEYLKNSTNINPQKNINSESNNLFSPNFSEIKNTKLKVNYLPATGLVDDFRIIIFILSMIFAFPIAFLSRKNFYKNP